MRTPKIIGIALVLLISSITLTAQTQKPIRDFVVTVENGKTVNINAEAFTKFPRTELKVKDHDGKESTYSGVELREILGSVGAKFGEALRGPMIGQFLVVGAADGYRAVYSLTELDPAFSDKTVIIADMKDGKPLDVKNGPWQVIASNEKKHARWVRQVTTLRVELAK